MIKKISLFSFVLIVVIVVTSDKFCVVSAQDVVSTDYWTPIVASLPSAFMGVLNLALISRLGSGGGLLNGFSSRFMPGSTSYDSGKKKMIFLGRHNIQVSNNNADKGEFVDEECCDEEENENDDEFDDDEEIDEEEEDDEQDNDKGKDKNKYKKGKKDKYKKTKGEDKNNDYKYKKYKKQEKKNVWGSGKYSKAPQNNYDFGSGQYPNIPVSSYSQYPPYKPYSDGYEEMSGLDFKSTALKHAISAQYPYIDPAQIYLPQGEESKNSGFHSDPRAVEPKMVKPQMMKPQMMMAPTPNKFSAKGETLLPIFEKSQQLPDKLPQQSQQTKQIDEFPSQNMNLPDISVITGDNLGGDRKNASPYNPYNDKPFIDASYESNEIESNKDLYSYDVINDNKYSKDDNKNHQKVFIEEFKPVRISRPKRSADSLTSDSSSRTGNVPPSRHIKNQTIIGLDKMSPETVIRMLLSAVNTRAQNEKREHFSGEYSEKPHKKVKKSHKKSHKNKSKYRTSSSSDDEVQTKSSSNRVVTKYSVKDTDRQPIKYVPLENYKSILNFPSERKHDRPNKSKSKSKNNKKYKYGGQENGEDQESSESVPEEEEEDEEEEEEEPAEDEEDENDLEGIPEDAHSTLQVIEKPEEKFNVGISSWMKRMFGFRSNGRRRRIFVRANDFDY